MGYASVRKRWVEKPALCDVIAALGCRPSVHEKFRSQNYLPQKRLDPVSSFNIEIMYSDVAEHTV